MGNSLQEQLLKAGLVDQKKLDKAKKQQRKQKKQRQHGKASAPNPDRQRAQQERAAKAERDRELNRKREEAAKRRETAFHIGQLIETHRVSREGGEQAFNFTDRGRIRRIYVSQEQQQSLARQKLVIAELGKSYELIPAEIGDKVLAREPAWPVIRVQDAPAEAEDDYYDKFQVPDDLIW